MPQPSKYNQVIASIQSASDATRKLSSPDGTTNQQPYHVSLACDDKKLRVRKLTQLVRLSIFLTTQATLVKALDNAQTIRHPDRSCPGNYCIIFLRLLMRVTSGADVAVGTAVTYGSS